MRIVFHQYRSSFAMSMENVQRRNEKFMGILLLVPCQMSGVCPNQMKKFVKRQRNLVARIKLLEQVGYLADQTAIRLRAVVTVSKEIIPQQRSMYKGLYDAVHEASASEID